MTTDIVRYEPPSSEEWAQLVELAGMVATTEFAPRAIRGNQAAVVAALLTGRELGIGPMQALRDVYIVNGRPSLAATLMVSRVRAAGHRFRTLRNDATGATVQIHRKGEPEPEPPVTFALDDARRAGLAGKDVWRQYPDRMCWARAASAACRRDAPECLGGVVYTPEEIESIPDDSEPATTTVTVGRPEAPAPPGTPAPSEGRQQQAHGGGAGHPGGAGGGEGARPAGATGEVDVAALVDERVPGMTLAEAAALLNRHRGARAKVTAAQLAGLTGDLLARMLDRLDELVAAEWAAADAAAAARADAERTAPEPPTAEPPSGTATATGTGTGTSTIAAAREAAQRELRGEAF